MKRIKSFKLFENLESEINLELLEDIIIDFIQMGLDYDIKIGSSSILDFDKLNKERELDDISNISIHSGDIDLYRKGKTNNGLSIDLFIESKISEFNIDDFEYAYNMVSEFLLNEYNLVPNYIYVNYHWTYQYFENVDMLRLEMFGGHLGDDPNTGWFHGKKEKGSKHFQAHKVTLGFYNESFTHEWFIKK
jgi:hypothetical protein